MSSVTGAKRTREQATHEEAAVPSDLARAYEESVDVNETMASILPMSDYTQWHILFENGTWIKNALDKIHRVLPDVGVFSIDYLSQEVEDPSGSVQQMSYFFLTLCQEFRERNGFVFLYYPLHYAAVSELYVEEKRKEMTGQEDQQVPIPQFAAVISQMVSSLRSSSDRGLEAASGAGQAQDAVSNQAKLVVLSLDNDASSGTQMLVVKPLSNNPFKDGRGKTKRTHTTMFASVSIQLLFEEFGKSHMALEKLGSSDKYPKNIQAMRHYMRAVDLDMFDFRWSVHNLSSAELHFLLKSVDSKQAPREYMQTQSQGLVDGDVLTRFRLFSMLDTSYSPARNVLIFNIQVMNQSTRQLTDVRFATYVHVLSSEDDEREKKQEECSLHGEQMRQALLRRTRFVRVEAPLIDEDFLSKYVPDDSRVFFDEYYAARTLAPLFSYQGGDSFTLYFGYRRPAPGVDVDKRQDIPGTMMIDVNRVAVDSRVAQMLIMVQPLDARVHESLKRTRAVVNLDAE